MSAHYTGKFHLGQKVRFIKTDEEVEILACYGTLPEHDYHITFHDKPVDGSQPSGGMFMDVLERELE